MPNQFHMSDRPGQAGRKKTGVCTTTNTHDNLSPLCRQLHPRGTAKKRNERQHATASSSGGISAKSLVHQATCIPLHGLLFPLCLDRQCMVWTNLAAGFPGGMATGQVTGTSSLAPSIN
ncbi:hypothetical protein Bbelb_086680 [Branchiostoma belcheri]|nr:hypothetical protein Bbelb_086680 [Branchiostoma belcheri]